MQITIGGKPFTFDQLAAAAAANNYPDILFFASGKVATPGGKAKFRIRLADGGSALHKWGATVEYTEVGGSPVGNMLDGYLLKKDDVTGNLEVTFEVNIGSGYQSLVPATIDPLAGGPIAGAVFGFDAGSGVTGSFGLLTMP